MRRPSARMQPHVVAATYNNMDVDMDGGPRARRVNQSRAGALPCFVQPGEARTIVETSDDVGTRRITELNPTTVYFVDDAGLEVKDVLTWVDASGRAHVYNVVGYYPPCGTSVVWRAVCEERV